MNYLVKSEFDHNNHIYYKDEIVEFSADLITEEQLKELIAQGCLVEALPMGEVDNPPLEMEAEEEKPKKRKK